MPTVALLMLQVASVVGPSATPGEAAQGSLLHPVPPSTCAAKANEIVVCGRDAETYRLAKGAAQDQPAALPKAEWKIFGNATAGIGFDQRSVGGYSAPAAMATIKVPF